MKPQYLMILGLALLLGADPKKDDAVKKELKKLQGTWVLAAVDFKGQGPAEQDVTSDARTEFVIRGNRYTTGQVNGRKGKGFLRIDPLKKPKTLDLGPTEAFKPGKYFCEIYELDGDTLRTCSVQKGASDPKNRPKKFQSGGKSDANVCYWKRVR